MASSEQLPSKADFLANLSHISIEDVAKLPSEKKECPICRDSLLTDEHTGQSKDLPIRLHGDHVFCAPCILSWVNEQNTCPYCRMDLYAKPPSDDDRADSVFDDAVALLSQVDEAGRMETLLRLHQERQDAVEARIASIQERLLRLVVAGEPSDDLNFLVALGEISQIHQIQTGSHFWWVHNGQSVAMVMEERAQAYAEDRLMYRPEYYPSPYISQVEQPQRAAYHQANTRWLRDSLNLFFWVAFDDDNDNDSRSASSHPMAALAWWHLSREISNWTGRVLSTQDIESLLQDRLDTAGITTRLHEGFDYLPTNMAIYIQDMVYAVVEAHINPAQ